MLSDQLPLPSATVVPTTVVPSVSYNLSVAPTSAVPLKVGVVTLVMRSLLELPLSEAALRAGVEGAIGAVVSMTTVEVLEAALTLPAESVALTLRL